MTKSVNSTAQLRMMRVAPHERNQCLLQSLNIVCLHPRILSLLAERSDDSRTGRVAAEEMPYPHDFPGINKRVGNRVRLRLLNSGGESLGKCMHGCGLTTQAQGPGARDATIATATLAP